MALICDTSGIFALYDADDAHHSAVNAAVEAEPGPLFLPTILLAEIDYLFSTRLGQNASLDFLESVEQSAFILVPFMPEDLVRCRGLLSQYRNLKIGIADASVVATAERLNILRLLTFDERHFRVIKPAAGGHFTLLPADAP
jgi:uncharacterized protein